jgi:hypothetical protein
MMGVGTIAGIVTTTGIASIAVPSTGIITAVIVAMVVMGAIVTVPAGIVGSVMVVNLPTAVMAAAGAATDADTIDRNHRFGRR